MNKSAVLGVLISTVVLVGAGVLYRDQDAQADLKQSAAPSNTPKVNVVQAQLLESSSEMVFNARLAPAQEASLFARSSGFVVASYADIGTRVKAGTVLAKIAAPELEASLISARAAQAQREAELLLASRNLERVEPLGTTGAVSAQQMDELKGLHEVAKANLNAATAEVKRIQSELAYLTLKAPFDGVITERNIDRGDRVSPSDSRMLYRIINSDVLRVQVDIPQPQFFRLKSGAGATLQVAELPGKPIPVEFKRSSEELRADSGTVRVEYEFDNRKHRLPAGLSASLRVSSNGSGLNLTIPANTVVYRDGGANVVTVDEQNTIQFKKISLGKNFPNSVEVLQGISREDRLVVNPNALLKAGQQVEVAESSPNPAR